MNTTEHLGLLLSEWTYRENQLKTETDRTTRTMIRFAIRSLKRVVKKILQK